MSVALGPVKVLIADDHGLFRTGLARLLSSDPRFEIVGEAKDGLDAISQTRTFKPDVVLMDLHMPQVNGAQAIKLLKAEAPEVEVLVVSAYADGLMVSDALANGAKGYVGKDSTLDAVASRILEVSTTGRKRTLARQAALSIREMHVLKQVAAGLSNKQIAHRLGISEKTVRNHLSRVFNKLRAANRTEAVMNAMRVGIQVV
jgi:DNA-binding NarL/FixJ family response regulator